MNNDYEAYEEMDRNDEEMIVEELQGKIQQSIAEKMFYHFEVKDDNGNKKEVCELSLKGVSEARRIYAEKGIYLREIPGSCKFEKSVVNDDCVTCTIYVERVQSFNGQEIRQDVVSGIAEACMYLQRKDGSYVSDNSGNPRKNKFATAIAAGKARRNGFRALLPQYICEQILITCKSKDLQQRNLLAQQKQQQIQQQSKQSQQKQLPPVQPKQEPVAPQVQNGFQVYDCNAPQQNPTLPQASIEEANFVTVVTEKRENWDKYPIPNSLLPKDLQGEPSTMTIEYLATNEQIKWQSAKDKKEYSGRQLIHYIWPTWANPAVQVIAKALLDKYPKSETKKEEEKK